MQQERSSDGWRMEPVIDWLLREGRLDADPRTLINALAGRLVAAGAPLCRLRLAFFTLHPQLAAWAYVWMRGRETSEERVPYNVRETAAYIGSPAQAMIEAGAPVRYRLDRLSPGDHRVLHELAAAGGTDYALLPLRFSDGSLNVLAVTTDDAQGFASEDLAKFDALCHALAPVLEVAATRRLAETLLDTYLGHRTGRRVLGGQIRRGAAEIIDAAIWYSDLRHFTALTETLASADMFALLNEYFGSVGAAVAARGGEILRFIGDAMLIIFPAGSGGSLQAACQAAVESALDAFAHTGSINRVRCRAGLPEIRFGVGLNAGEVMYGNVGAPDRLDFTVLGPAVNRAARLETLTKQLDVPLLMSPIVAAKLERPVRSLGLHRLRDLSEPMEVFALAPAEEPAPASKESRNRNLEEFTS